MDYTPQPGDIGLAKITGIVGKLIWAGQYIYGEGGPWTHAFVVLENGTLIEAEPGGARIVPISEYNKQITGFLSLPLTDEQRARIVELAKTYEGTPYSFLDYAAMFLYRLRIRLPGIRRRVESSGHLICSQLADKMEQDVNFQLFDDGRWNGYVSPGGLTKLGKKNGWLRTVNQIVLG